MRLTDRREEHNYIFRRLFVSSGLTKPLRYNQRQNYDEAVENLEARIGNKQQIINHCTEIFLNLDCVTPHYNIKGLQQLYVTLESNVRSFEVTGSSL